MKSDRLSIWFEPAIKVLEQNECRNEEFLQGLRIRDPRFEAWKSDIRLARSRKNGLIKCTPQKATILVLSPDPEEIGSELIQQTIVNHFTQNIRETTSAQTIIGNSSAVVCGSKSDMSLEVFAGSRPQDSYIAIRMKAEPSGAIIWSKSLTLPKALPAYDPEGDLALACFAATNEAADRASHFLNSNCNEISKETRADALVARGVKELFTFGKDCFRRAEEFFSRANAIHPHPVALAWLASVPMVEFNETGTINRDALEQTHRELIQRILNDWPDNGVALALLSMVELMINDNLDAATNLSNTAQRVNPYHPLSPLSVATIALRQNALSRSETYIEKAMQVGESSNIRQWWTVQAAMTCIRKQQYEKAVYLATAASLRAPKFRPPLRHLYPLYIMLGQPEKARRILRQLQKLEPDFSLENIRKNPGYPATLIRNSPLIDLHDIDVHESQDQ